MLNLNRISDCESNCNRSQTRSFTSIASFNLTTLEFSFYKLRILLHAYSLRLLHTTLLSEV